MKRISLMYHDVIESEHCESGFQFQSAFDYKVLKKDFLIQISNISKYCEENFISKDLIYFTFDDGGSSFYSNIAPILEEFGFKGYFFISTAFINMDGFLTSEEIISLYNKGHIIGSHSDTHPILLKYMPNEKVESEWRLSINILENIIKTKVEYASIPGGSYSNFIGEILKKNGIKFIFTSKPTLKIRYLDEKTQIFGRYTIYNKTEAKDILNLFNIVSIFKLKQYCKWYVFQILKSLLGKYYIVLRKNFI